VYGKAIPRHPAAQRSRRRSLRADSRVHSRYPGTGAILVAALMIGLAGLFTAGRGVAELGLGIPMPSWAAQHGLFTTAGSAALPRSVPTQISIAAIRVSAPIEPVGLAPDGTIAAPAVSSRNLAGWYEPGPTPGQAGVAVIVGHVDNHAGPSVFYRLGRLQPGQHIEIARADRAVAVFRIDAVRSYPKTEVPASVWTDRGPPGLRLVTCGGAWVGGRFGYSDNIIVFATLVG
jgi:hypothetical protein